MSETHPELIDALRDRAQQKVESIWQEARASAEQIRTDSECRIEEQRSQAMQELAAEVKELRDTATAEAETAARGLRVATTTALVERLDRLARASLPRLRDEDYEIVFDALAGELPSRAWQRVRVNPADKGLAQSRFPDAEIVCDEAVLGGMDVEAEDGRIRIGNTLETRLARAWPVILPGLVNSILEGFSDHRPPA